MKTTVVGMDPSLKVKTDERAPDVLYLDLI